MRDAPLRPVTARFGILTLPGVLAPAIEAVGPQDKPQLLTATARGSGGGGAA
ncbi:hypothetical protein [Streptomyces sp. NPDC055060]